MYFRRRAAIAFGGTAILLCSAVFDRSAAWGEIIVDDTFADGDRTNQAPPLSLQWNYGGHYDSDFHGSVSVGVSSDALVWTRRSSFSALWGHFAPADSPLTLAVGEALHLAFDVRLSEVPLLSIPGVFRWALFNSNGSRPAADFTGTNVPGVADGSVFSTWRGYETQAFIQQNSTTSNLLLTRERTGVGDGLFASTEWTELPGSGVVPPILLRDTTYAVSLTLTRDVSGIIIQGAMDNMVTNAVIDATDPIVAFDSIALFAHLLAADTITIDNVRLEVIPVPEPSSAQLLAFVSALLVYGAKRWGSEGVRIDRFAL